MSAKAAPSCTTGVLIESQEEVDGKFFKSNFDYAERQKDDVSHHVMPQNLKCLMQKYVIR